MIRRRAGRSDARALHGLFPLAKDIGGGKGTCRRIPESRTDIRERRRRSNFHHLLPPVRTCAAAATRRVFCGLDERYCSSNAAGMRAQAARGNRYVYRRRGESCHPGRPRLSNARKSASRLPPVAPPRDGRRRLCRPRLSASIPESRKRGHTGG